MIMAREVIGLFLRSLENDYQQRLRDDAMATASHLGFKVKVFHAHTTWPSSAPDRARDRRDRRRAGRRAREPGVRRRPRRSGARGRRAGVGWALLNREAGYLDDLRAFPGLPIFSTTPDQVEIGGCKARRRSPCCRRAATCSI
jgi:hypothetical protein